METQFPLSLFPVTCRRNWTSKTPGSRKNNEDGTYMSNTQKTNNMLTYSV
jgi:hypothetical protein